MNELKKLLLIFVSLILMASAICVCSVAYAADSTVKYENDPPVNVPRAPNATGSYGPDLCAMGSSAAASLAVIGYSLNDTIVVYDRIRENMRLIRKNEFIDILNISVNQTLSRTIITSLTTLFVLFSLLLAGGIAVKFFATAMIVGVLVGTYSSIFIASTSLYFLGIGTELQ